MASAPSPADATLVPGLGLCAPAEAAGKLADLVYGASGPP
ncbi:hypothetical protein C8E99_2634 [Citricoccus muralis]|uniref:Uncharacterized protein n=1 Tax=Citricoccus muralis TaxID=169134 RepID=A0A3D9LG13_9MICC|nr:hypothetical protein C8E99_2634 [Citricoccus muralis]